MLRPLCAHHLIQYPTPQAFALRCCSISSCNLGARPFVVIYIFSHPSPYSSLGANHWVYQSTHSFGFFSSYLSSLPSVLSFAYIFVFPRWLPLSTPRYLSVACFPLRLSPSTVHYPLWCSNKYDCQSNYRSRAICATTATLGNLKRSDPVPRCEWQMMTHGSRD